MAKLIIKSPYFKGGGSGGRNAAGYLRYIATRERVELLTDDRPPTHKQERLIKKLTKDFPDSKTSAQYAEYTEEPTKYHASEFISSVLENHWPEVSRSEVYMKYIATRPRAERLGRHGLFGDEDAVDLQKAMTELSEYSGNIWTHIISLKREDAERLGYDNAKAWRNLLRTHRNEIAAAMNIPPQDFRWYAAFHDEGHHPHVHMMAWSVKPGQAYLNQEGIRKIKRITKNVLGRTQAEVKEKLKRALEDNERIDAAKSQDLTVGQWAALWFKNYAKPSVRESTAEHYRNFVENHIVPDIGKIKLRKLTTLDIQKFYNKTRESGRIQRYEGMEISGLSNKTVRSLHAMLRQCLDQAVMERLIPYNPAANCKLPPKEKKEMQIIPPEKLGDYLRAAEEHGVLPMFYLELTTGLRRGELLALLWTDLNIKEKCLTVSKSVARGKGELRVTEPKTKNSIRTVYIDNEAIRLLVEDRKNHPFSPYLFPSPVTGGMYGPDCVGRIHKKLLKRAGIEEHVRFHDLRRTFATMALQNGVDIKTVSGMLGHYSTEFTLDVYTNVTKEMQKDAAKKIGGFMAEVM